MPSISDLVERFDSFDADLWAQSYGDYSVTAGKGRIVTNHGVYSAFMTDPEWSVPDGATLSARVVVNALGGATTDCYAAIRIMPTTPAGTDFGVEVNRVTATLHVQSRVAYDDAGQSSVTYSGTSMAFWRIQRTGSNLVVATAPEASEGTPGTWTTRRTVAVPAWMSTATNLSVVLEAYRNNGTVGNVDFDYINAGYLAPSAGNAKFMQFF